MKHAPRDPSYRQKNLFTNIMKRLLYHFHMGPLRWWPFIGSYPDHVTAPPEDLHLAEPLLAREFYHGRFPLAGRVVQTESFSPFIIQPPSPEWGAALHDFSWLHSLISTNTKLSHAHARALTEEWLHWSGNHLRKQGWQADVTARRIISWLSYAHILCQESSSYFQKTFFHSLAFQIRYLHHMIKTMNDEEESKLQAAIALNFASLCFSLSQKHKDKAQYFLEHTLEKQILLDGGHISRNPAILLNLLVYLIPLRSCYHQIGETAPPALLIALDRMIPALRFFQHRDNSLAHFNGAGPILSERLDLVLNSDKMANSPLSYAAHSGYQRLALGQTTIIADTGKTLLGPLSSTSNAGCLSFEMSSGKQRFIINCGIDPYGPPPFRFLGRLTASHSTATIGNTSSCRFQNANKADTILIDGPTQLKVKRIEEHNLQGFIALHDGYKKNFDLLHERSMTLALSGDLIQGQDRFFYTKSQENSKNIHHEIAIRFHLHPTIEIKRESESMVHITAPHHDNDDKRQDSWLFSANTTVTIEDSIYFSSLSGTTKTQQLVLLFFLTEYDSVQWSFRRNLYSGMLPND